MRVLGVDIGGTFTDLMLYDDEADRLWPVKMPSVPGEEWLGLEAGLDELMLPARSLQYIVHGTTVATNALIEGTGARAVLVTTRGFGDLVEIGRGMRLSPGSLFNTNFRRPPPLVPRPQRVEFDERIAADGSVVKKPDESALAALIAQVRAAEPEVVAVCLINSYANPAHERLAAASLRAALPGVPVFESHRVSPEFREYERVTTTVINAGVSPVLERYLGNFDSALVRRDFAGALFVMTSNGGTISRNLASDLGALTILSGPVGGVRGAITAVSALGRDRLITLDMGGTSTDVALVQGTEPQLARETVINGFPIRLPQLNIIAVGTGGGSIAAFDEGGGLNVGPRSAGAMPGPACYGLGGMVPTLTDANLALGRLGAALLGGRMHLDRGLAETVIGRLAERQGMSAIRLAEGIVAISVAKMSNAIREVSVKQGFDPRDFTLVAFGGAGPMHACFLAEDLGMREVVIPPHPGNVSAYGLLASDLRQDSVRTWIRSWPDLALAHLRAALAEQAAGLRSEVAAAGWPVSAADTSFAVDVRYLGQAFELTVPLPGDDQASLAQLPSLFEARHRVVYGHTHDRPLEIVNLRVALAVQKPFHFRLPPWNRRGAEEGKSRQVFLDGAWHEVPVLSRDGLQLGDRLAGPVIVAEAGSTTVIPHEWELSVAENGALLLAKAQARSAATASDLIGRSQS